VNTEYPDPLSLKYCLLIHIDIKNSRYVSWSKINPDLGYNTQINKILTIRIWLYKLSLFTQWLTWYNYWALFTWWTKQRRRSLSPTPLIGYIILAPLIYCIEKLPQSVQLLSYAVCTVYCDHPWSNVSASYQAHMHTCVLCTAGAKFVREQALTTANPRPPLNHHNHLTWHDLREKSNWDTLSNLAE